MICKEFLRQNKMNYAIFTPERLDSTLPLIVYLHGAGERGEHIDHLYRLGLAKKLHEGTEYHAVILCPQCPRNFIWNNIVTDLKKLIDNVTEEYKIMPDRIFITGASMGGYGTWEMALTYPSLFAAVAPVAGGGTTWRAARLHKTPIRAYHGSADSAVEAVNSKLMVDAVNRNGGHAELVVFEGLEHNEGIEEAYNNTDIIPWLLSHRRTDFSYVPDVCEEYF